MTQTTQIKMLKNHGDQEIAYQRQTNSNKIF